MCFCGDSECPSCGVLQGTIAPCTGYLDGCVCPACLREDDRVARGVMRRFAWEERKEQGAHAKEN